MFEWAFCSISFAAGVMLAGSLIFKFQWFELHIYFVREGNITDIIALQNFNMRSISNVDKYYL